MTSTEIRKKYLEFFKEKGHKVIPSASLIPENDPSVLFTTAGMHPLVPYLLGEKHPSGNKLADVQKCIRTGDIEEVGDGSHHTFFEMLGNWSLGNPDAKDGIGAGYFKKEAIEWSYEFLTSEKWLNLDKNRLAVSVFAGDDDAPFDREAFDIWKDLKIPEKRIAKLPKKNNWWGPAGETGPCGPDTEMFYWVGNPDKIPDSFNDDNNLWLEIWNDVFMQYNKTADGKFKPLTQQNVDTGMGLERTLAVINGLDDNYKTDLFWPIIKKIEKLSDKKYEGENIKAMRIIADHLKAATFILGDEKGIASSNTGQGYVLRRLIRRAIRYGRRIGIKSFTKEVAKVVIKIYKEIYPELSKNKDFILTNLSQEEKKFEKTLEKGMKKFDRVFRIQSGQSSDFKNIELGPSYTILPSDIVFELITADGFPEEMIKEIGKEKNIVIDWEDVHILLKKHQELSRTSSTGMFKGGLSDNSEETKKLHTATHLLRQALENVLNKSITQKGSNINAERLRFDFTFGRKLTDEEKEKVEKLVNQKIEEDLPVNRVIMKKEEAEKTGAAHTFGDKYGDKVSIYYVGDSIESAWSKEFCGGPHVERTSDLASKRDPKRAESESKGIDSIRQAPGVFKIIKEEAVSIGVRRIKATLK